MHVSTILRTNTSLKRFEEYTEILISYLANLLESLIQNFQYHHDNWIASCKHCYGY